jgi:hypothetical protein
MNFQDSIRDSFYAEGGYQASLNQTVQDYRVRQQA